MRSELTAVRVGVAVALLTLGLSALALLPVGVAGAASGGGVAAPGSGRTTGGSTARPSSPAPGRPYLGLDTWYAYGSRIDEGAILDLAQQDIATGLASAGYRLIWLDAGWWNGSRRDDGTIAVDPARWPDGIGWLVRYLHARGLKVGIYTDAGASGCLANRAGSLGHYDQDAQTFAAWRIDAVKVDFCGGRAVRADPRDLYGKFARALDAAAGAGRRPLLNVCNGYEPASGTGSWPSFSDSAFDSWSFAPQIADSWRTSRDIGSVSSVSFGGVLHNLDATASQPWAAQPGRFVDPDYLVPGHGLTVSEARAQLTLWSMLSAPLMLSAQPARLRPALLSLYRDRELLAVDQDALQAQPVPLRGHGLPAGVEVWIKPLADGGRAVAVLNRSGRGVPVRLSMSAVGSAFRQRARVRNVWSASSSSARRFLSLRVGARDALLLRVSAVGHAARPSGHPFRASSSQVR